MATNQASFTLSIRPPTRKEDAEPLTQLIGRINEERGHFRNITEDSLRAEIEAQEVNGGEAEVEDEEEIGVADPEDRRKELYAARTELLKFIGQAQNEALTALDFISLLISKDAPKMAETSMSPLLKQLVPAGTLGFEKVQIPPPSKAQEDHNRLVCAGWSFKSVETAADSLLQTATRLGAEMEREARYWDQVLSISEKKWPVCRMPKERHTIGVRFGFSEASPIFHARGLAALRPDVRGDIILDQGLSKKPKSMRIRILNSNETISTSKPTSDISSSQATEAGIEALIRQARDSLFEEELFHELLREVRTDLASSGVSVENHVICVPPRASQPSTASEAAQYTILVDLMDRDEHQAQTRPASRETAPHFNLFPAADTIALTLRILLTQAYHQRFAKRTAQPPPLSDEKRTAPIHSLLRPVLAHLQHLDAVRGLASFFSRATSTLNVAGVPTRHDFQTVAPDFTHLSTKKDTSTALTESLLAALSAPLKARASLHVTPVRESGTRTMAVDITTNLSPPTYGTVFHLTPPQTPNLAGLAAATAKQDPLPFPTLPELTRHVTYILRRALVSSIAARPRQDDDASSQWSVEQSGTDLRRVWRAEKKVRRLSVAWQGDALMLVCAENGARARVLGRWGGDDRVGGEGRSFAEVLGEAENL